MTETHPGSLMARFARPRSDETTRFAVVADPHLSTEAEGTSKLFEHTEAHFRAAVEDMAGRDLDAVLSPGDLTKDGELWNYETVDGILESLDVPFYAVPGNHDVRKDGDDHDTPSLDRFVEQYTPGSLPFRADVGDVTVVGLNSSGGDDRLLDSHEGDVPPEQLDFLRDALAEEGPVFVLMHHNLPPTYDQLRSHRDEVEAEMAIPPITRNTDDLVDALATGTDPVVLTGHLHLPAVATIDGVREVMSPTTCSFPQSYLLFEVGPDGTEVRLVPVADTTGMELAHNVRGGDSTTSRGLTSIAAARLARFPLVEE
ncbi:metallophosphoesterase [Salarchaeum sp. JOR-1]|uniref:metallophosphoesterase family protein n=1 Tax=Salarchaeum sp. JOR-1 TaxID=2599399 RepID=UPI0011982CEC|nr:metallophosphoesterase [Salarchaeum sp. JOR-1]QDX41107.1 metallophosphoesterase [Salarchaeum sp. JOR-1]